MRYYYVKNWQKFQHYKHRNPPWVKLHRSLFTSPDWIAWTDHDRLVALCCLSLASLDGGWLPDDALWLKRACHLNWRVNFEPLVKSGFLTVHASKVLAPINGVLATCKPESRVQSTENIELAKNGFGKGEKRKPRHGAKTRDGSRLWLDCGTIEWAEYAKDYKEAHSGIDPPVQWNGAGTWFNLAGEIQQ